MAARTRASAISIATGRGGLPDSCASSSTARVLAPIFSAMASNAAARVPPWYSTLAQMTPAALKAIGPASDGMYSVDYVAPINSEAGEAFLNLARQYLTAEEVARVNRYTMTGYASTATLIAAMRSCTGTLTWACTIAALQNNPPMETGVMAPITFGEGGRFSNSPVRIMRADFESLSYELVGD